MSRKSFGWHISRILLLGSSFCFLAGAGITIADIGARALFNSHVDAAIELTTLFIALGALLSMPVTYAYRKHITAKLLSEFLPAGAGRVFVIIGGLLSVLFAGILLLAVSINLQDKFGSPETTPDTGLPVYLLLTVVDVALAMALVAALRALWRTPADDRDEEVTHG